MMMCMIKSYFRKLIMFRNERSMSGLKAQQLIAQGVALGRETAANAPCKGKSIRNQAIMNRTLSPLQGVYMIYPPQGVALGYGLLPLRGVRNMLITNYTVLAKFKFIIYNGEL